MWTGANESTSFLYILLLYMYVGIYVCMCAHMYKFLLTFQFNAWDYNDQVDYLHIKWDCSYKNVLLILRNISMKLNNVIWTHPRNQLT